MDENRLPFSWDRETGFSVRGDTTPATDTQTEDMLREAAPTGRRGTRRPATRREQPFDGSLTQSDLLQTDRLNSIRSYMIDRKGVQYRDMDDAEVVDDFVEHMRFFNANLVSTGGEVRYISNASEEQKARAAAAYELYDQLGSVFANDGFFGAVEGIGEYVQAAALDPSNYIGLLTGGLGKAGAMGVTAGSRALVRQAVKEAGERALASGATREAAEEAGRRAGDRVIQRLAQRNVSSGTSDRLVNAAAERARRYSTQSAVRQAEREVIDPLMATAARRSLVATTAIDGTLAALNDYQIQNVMLDVGVQEEYSKLQTGFSSILGLVGGGAQLAGRGLRGASRLGDGEERLANARMRAEEEFDIATAVDEDTVQEMSVLIDDTLSAWEEKVSRGLDLYGDANAPVEIMYEIMLGPDGNSGLAGMLRDQGIRITRNRHVSDVMTNIIRQLPEEQLIKINQKLEPLTGLTLGEASQMGQRLSDLLAKDINRSGRVLNVMSQVKKTINAGAVHSSNMMDAIARRSDIEEEINKETNFLQRASNVGMYSQSVWRRLLVSSPATSMINVAGFSQFAFGQTVADMFNAGTFMLSGLARGGMATAKGREHIRMARVYSTIQAQKMRNLVDPFTTHDTYMALLNENKELSSRLFESFTGGVDRNIARFNLDPNSKGVKVTESVVRAANQSSFVLIQDSFTKSQMFITELDKALRLNKNTTLDEVMSTGVIDDIFDDNIINPALDSTLKSVYSKNYTTDDQGLLGNVAKFIEGISNTPVLGTVLPFGRFLNNTVATVYQWGPLSLAPAAFRIAKASADKGERIMAQEAFARAAVGTAALAAAYEYDKKRREEGLAYNEVKLSDGTIIDAKNTFPYSYFLVMGRIVGLALDGEPIPDDLKVEFGTQIAVGQAATDLQFGNDMQNVYDVLFSVVDEDRESVLNLGKGLMRGLGNYFAGYSRPLDAANKLVGYFSNTDAARDVRQAEGINMLTQASSRYVDNIFEALVGRVDAITGEELRVATREGALRDANPLARIFGVNVRPTRTATEQAYSMANLAEYKASLRTNIPEYDRIFNGAIAGPLNRAMSELIRDERFLNGNTDVRKQMLQTTLREMQSQYRSYVDAGGEGPQGYLLGMRRRAAQRANESQTRMAIAAMRENFGFDGAGVNDMTLRELQYFLDYIDHFEAVLR